MLKKFFSRAGFAMTEMLLATSCSIAIITTAFVLYNNASDKRGNSEILRNLASGIDNIRTYYAFEGSYTQLSNLSGTDFYKKEIFPKTWRCTNKQCLGPKSAVVSFSSTADTFTVVVDRMDKTLCVETASNGWYNIDSVKINGGSTYSGTNVPVTAKNAISGCSQKRNKVEITFR